jgi:pimeloyl-ACP methyl ester carboxylesterase
MIEMPPLQFAQTNGIRMGYYEAGPKTDTPPVILCHGWPEIAFSWRHQIKALAAAGIRVIAPDQSGYGATDRPEAVESYDIEQLTGDLVGLLDHLKIDKAIFVGHDWGGFVVWQMPLRHIDRVAGVVGSIPRTPTVRRRTRSNCCASASASRCISCSFRTPRVAPTRYSTAGSNRPSTPL